MVKLDLGRSAGKPTNLARRAAVLGCLAFLAAACGSSVEVDGSGGAAGAGAGSVTTTSSLTTSGTTSTTTSGGESCESFLPPPDLGGSVEIRLVNATDADLFLGEVDQGCGGFDPFELTAVSGDPPAMYQSSLDVCELTCASLQSSGCECAADCMMPYVIRVIPGGSYVARWVGHVYERPQMPAECFEDPNCGPICPVEVKAPVSLRVSAQAHDAVACTSSTCTCPPDNDGSCFIYDGNATVAGAELSASTEWNEGTSSVTVTFGP